MSYGYVHARPSVVALAQIGFDPAAYTVGDADGEVVLVVKRTGPSAGACSASFATADGTALAGLDYEATSGTVSWVDGDSADKTIPVAVLPTNPLRWNPAETGGSGASIDGPSVTFPFTGYSSTGETAQRTGRVYIEIPYSGESMFDGRCCYFELYQADSWLSLRTDFSGSALAETYNGTESSSVDIDFSNTEGIVGFLVDWDAMEMRVHIDGGWVNIEDGTSNIDPALVPGVPLLAQPIVLGAGVTDPF